MSERKDETDRRKRQIEKRDRKKEETQRRDREKGKDRVERDRESYG